MPDLMWRRDLGLRSMKEILNNLSQAGRGISEATDAQVGNATKTESVIAKFQSETEKLSASLQAAFPPLESQIVALTTGMKALNDAIYGVINHTNTETRSWLSAGTVIAGFLAGTLLPLMGKAGTVLNLFRGVGGAAAVAETGAAGAAAGGAAAGGGLAAAAGSTAAVAAAGAAGYAAGTYVFKPMIDGIASIMTGRSDETLGGALSEIFDPNTKKVNSLFGPQQRSTVDSPAAATPAAPAVGPGIEKAPASSDINSTLRYQSNLLAQQLLATETLISVNKDILRYTRNQT